MEYKLFKDKPKFHDAEFYSDRPVSDHINEDGHRPRLIRALREVEYLVHQFPIHSLADFGAGNGGFLNEVRKKHPHLQLRGYDMQPSNITWAKEKYQVNISQADITADTFVSEPTDIVVLAETLEHLVDPHGLLGRLKNLYARFIVASSPANETDDRHYEFHLWAWTEKSYPDMFRSAGWRVLKHYLVGSTQIVVADRGEKTTEEISTLCKKIAIYLKQTGRKEIRILEIGDCDVAGYFSMGHFCFSQVLDPERAIAAAVRYPWLKVSTKDWEVDADIIINGKEILIKPTSGLPDAPTS